MIRKISLICWVLAGTAGAQIITTVAGGGLPITPLSRLAATIPVPQGIAVDAQGNVYVTSEAMVFKLDTAGTLTRVAGTGVAGYSGDGGPATSAQMGAARIAVDGRGNLYVASGNPVRKVSAAGIITTVAGNGTLGYSGDGGPATRAQLNWAFGVALDASGNLYIADMYNHRVRKVSAVGIITTVAGNGSFGYSGDGGPATSAQLNEPDGVAVDTSGNLYIADFENGRVRKVSAAGLITTVAGGGSSYPGDGGPATNAAVAPEGVAVDASGNLYIADGNGRITKVSPAGTITTVAGGAGSDVPYGVVAVDPSGNLYIANDDQILRVSEAGIVTTLSGSGSCCYSGDGGPATNARLSYLFGLALDGSGNVYIADTGDGLVHKVSAAGIISTVAGGGSSYPGDGGPATSTQLGGPSGVAVDAGGNLYFADYCDNRVRKVSAAGIITTVAGNGSPGYSGDGGPATSAQLNNPNGVAVDASGNLYIADTGNNRIRKVSAAGIITAVAGDGSYGYSGDGGPATSAQLNGPFGAAVDASGNLYIADTGNGRVRRVSTAGIITTVAGTARTGFCCDYSGDGGPATSANLDLPHGVAVDASGNLYIADSYNQRVRKVSAAGIIMTVAGGGSSDPGDGGPATSAWFGEPFGVALDASGNLYIADTFVCRVNLVTSAAVFSLALTHSGNFKAGQNGATYAVTVNNAPSAGATSGTVTVKEIVPAGLTLVSMTGLGWNCGGNACTRSDPLSGGSSYPAITVTVNVASGGTQVTNQVSVSGGGGAAASAIDLTWISYLLTTAGFPPGSGGVIADPASADGYYNGGTRVCLTASPNPGWRFSSWGGDAVDGAGCLTMDGNRSVTAEYHEVGRRRP